MDVSGAIRVATEKDIEIIHQWLLNHERRGVSDTFLCNWNLTKKVYSEGGLLVFVDDAFNEPIAYIWKDFGVLEVREDIRGERVGRKLVEYALNEALNSNITAINIECSPSTSIPFWKHMGFTIYSEKHAYIIIQKKLELPINSQEIILNIDFYPDCKQWEPETEAVESFCPQAVRSRNGVIHIASRISIFSGKPEWNNKPVVGITIDGEECFIGTAKSSKAREFGVKREGCSFSIEKIYV